jgi:hypothetical protein
MQQILQREIRLGDQIPKFVCSIHSINLAEANCIKYSSLCRGRVLSFERSFVN